MTAIAPAFSRVIITINDSEILKQLVLLCAVGLFVSLLMLTYGLDLSPGFFQRFPGSYRGACGCHERSADST
jgi:ribose/xylose/arabinose/galactoside ABC-type transport system permease subunit